ncbi:MAG TPA: four-helix bundle copper-binding protein [Roseiflexaceae bacterium]|nr:four-helix bundle copper-binding protein [Roseiflexaceae bacterium]
MENTARHSMDGHIQQCIQECTNCHSICLATVPHCLEMGGAHASPAHIGLLLDCAEICQTSANFMLRGSALHTHTCGVCADICERC